MRPPMSAQIEDQPAGRLWVLVGGSGAGKDSLLRWVASAVRGDPRVRIAQRWITREPHPSEPHHGVDDEGFDALLARQAFALHWQAHGTRYAIGREIDDWLANGCDVLVNGSREHVPAILARYPEARIVHVEVSPEVMQQRLAARGRESASQIEHRRERHARLAGSPSWEVLNNDGPLDQAGSTLLAWIQEAR